MSQSAQIRSFRPGIDVLLREHKAWLRGKRVGLVSHVAAVDAQGCTTAERLWRDDAVELTCLMGPEHGFFGRAGAGQACRSRRHPAWGIPVYSLYGAARKPTARMLRGVDTIVVDLQDLGFRCYTYLSTLCLVLEAAAETGRAVVVADRPIPLPCVVDGPVPEPHFRSFVSLVDTPLSTGMTPGEAARWIRAHCNLDVDLRVAPMAGYDRSPPGGPGWPPWIPPSPAMVSWESALCYPATVCLEALGAVDHGRATGLPFQLVGARWMNGADVVSELTARKLPGVRFYAHRYNARPRQPRPRMLDGLRLVVTDPVRYRPALTAVTLVGCLQKLYGVRRVWAARSSRPEFFDKLFGTPRVRQALLEGEDARGIARRWGGAVRRFKRERQRVLLY